MLMNLTTLVTGLCILWVSQVFADTFVGAQYAFLDDVNPYSPSIMWDEQDNLCKMWYHSNPEEASIDHIRYRTSPDCKTWGSATTVLDPSTLGFAHVGDPSVTKFARPQGGYQYTMFYSVCLKPCEATPQGQGGNATIYSSASADGINWYYPRPVFQAGVMYRAQPSAIWDATTQTWDVYFEFRHIDLLTHIGKITVPGNREPGQNEIIVYTHPVPPLSPEVRKINGLYHLFWSDRINVDSGLYTYENIVKVTSSSPNSFSSSTFETIADFANEIGQTG